MATIVGLYCLSKMTTGHDRWRHQLGGLMSLIVLIATGSRTPWGAGLIAVFVLLLLASAVRLRTLVGTVLLAPVIVMLVLSTGLIEQILTRGDDGAELGTLSNRTIAWQAALDKPADGWELWFGAGLSRKQIDVPGRWWSQQLLDNSWISALVQAGVIGTFVCVLLVVHAFCRWSMHATRLQGFGLALVVYLSLQGILESGLFDASVAFLAILCVTLPTDALFRDHRIFTGGRYLLPRP